MKTIFTITVDTDLEVESYWWRSVLKDFVTRILIKEGDELRKKKKKANTDFSVTVECIEGGTPCRTDGEVV